MSSPRTRPALCSMSGRIARTSTHVLEVASLPSLRGPPIRSSAQGPAALADVAPASRPGSSLGLKVIPVSLDGPTRPFQSYGSKRSKGPGRISGRLGQPERRYASGQAMFHIKLMTSFQVFLTTSMLHRHVDRQAWPGSATQAWHPGGVVARGAVL